MKNCVKNGYIGICLTAICIYTLHVLLVRGYVTISL
jgi:hypothetical protein